MKHLLLINRTCIFLFLCFIAAMAVNSSANAQGCVAVRSVSGFQAGNSQANLMPKQMQLTTAFRYLHSYKHFRGKHEETHRVKQNTEVINDSYFLDFTFTYAITNQLTTSFTVPLAYNDRSSLYEHKGNTPGNPRYHTQSKGLGDIRLNANYWLFDPSSDTERNLGFGLGFKAPTGDFNAKDDFNLQKRSLDDVTGDSIVNKPVDQSIQLGDGGWGITVEMQSYKKITSNVFSYFNGYYLINPKNTNGTLTGRRNTLNTTTGLPINNIESMSVADQYMARMGMSYAPTFVNGLVANLGLRLEGIPAYDLIGHSDGFRRPGYTVSAEPSFAYARAKNTFSLSLPLAMVRNRTKSASDILLNNTGGDAAFADYLLFVAYTKRF